MITSKQRAKLRAMANGIDTIVHIGKDGITDTVLQQMREALLARELVKARVQDNAPVFSREAAQELGERLDAEIIQVIGTRFVLYKRHPKKPVITIV